MSGAAEPGRPLSASARRVQDAIRAAGHDHVVFELEFPVRTAADAAGAVGCEVGQIVKSLVFRTDPEGEPVLVLASGAHRVDEERIAALVGRRVVRAEPAFVRERTGFAVGGVPPLGHDAPLPTFVDESLLAFEALWAAAGHPNSLFRLAPADLVRLTGGRVARVA